MRLIFDVIKKLFVHKYYVFVAGRHLGVPLHRLILHDLSKLRPREFKFWMYRCIDPNIQEFDIGWLHHYHYNKHHWQYWVLLTGHKGNDSIRALEIPDVYMKEMIADWAGAGKSKTGKWDICSWYLENRSNIVLHKNTAKKVDRIIYDNFAIKDVKYGKWMRESKQLCFNY